MLLLPAPIPALELLEEHLLLVPMGASDGGNEEIEQRANAHGFVDERELRDVGGGAIPDGAEEVEDAEGGRKKDDADVDFLLGGFGVGQEVPEDVEDGD